MTKGKKGQEAAIACDPRVTTNANIRRMNLEHLIEKRTGGNQSEFARQLGLKSAAYITQLLSETTEANIGDQFARRCEERFGLQIGWMDVLHDTAIAAERYRPVPLLDLEQARRWRMHVQQYQDELRGASARPAIPQLPIAIAEEQGESVHAYRNTGSAMAPALPEGCLLIVNPDVPAEVGSYVVACLSDKRVVVRRLQIEDGREVLAAIDPRFPHIPRSQAQQLLRIRQFVCSLPD